MKYVMLQFTKVGLKCHIPIIFPNILVHKDVADYMIVLLSHKHQWDAKAVSAGEVCFIGNRVVVSGESATLGLKAKPEDAYLIQMHDYNAGLL